MKIFKNIVTVLLSFLLMIGILCSTFLFIKNNYLNKKYLLKKFDEMNLYSSVYEEVREGFENYIYQSGLDISIIDKICTKEKVKQDIISVVDYIYGDEKATIDSTEIRQNLDIAINEYVEKEGRKLSKQETENINKFEDLIENSYKEKIGIYQKGSDKISGKIPLILSLTKKARLISLISSAVVLILLVIVNAKKVSFAGSFFGVSVFASGMIMIITKSIINSKIPINELVIFTKSLSSVMINIINSILSTIQVIGIWYIVLGILIIIAMNFLYLKDKKS